MHEMLFFSLCTFFRFCCFQIKGLAKQKRVSCFLNKLLPYNSALIFIISHVYVTHLHKTSHKSPNIQFQKIAFYLKMSKSVIFCFHQNNIFWARFFQNICFLHYSAGFFKYLGLFLKFI